LCFSKPEGRHVGARRVFAHSQVQVLPPWASHVEDDAIWIRDSDSTYWHQEQQQRGGTSQRREQRQQNLRKQNNWRLPVTRFRSRLLCKLWGTMLQAGRQRIRFRMRSLHFFFQFA
jgi:hypothetical protein